MSVKVNVMDGRAQLAEADLTNDALTAWADRVGNEMRIANTFNQLASYEAIRNFVNGIGDINPLYRDADYTAKTKYEALIAPPSWVASVYPHWILQGLPGIHSDHSASDWEFLRPIYVNDKITPKNYFAGFDVKKSKFAGRVAFEYQRFEYWNQRGELVSCGHNAICRYERQTAIAKSEKGEGKYDEFQMPHQWSKEEMARVDADVLAQEITGPKTRYWEDVAVGDELIPVVKGIFGLTDMVAYCVGAAPVQIAAHRAQLQAYKDHPAWAFRDPTLGAWEPVYSVHYNVPAAKGVGALYMYDVGVQRHSWNTELLTNWMGDEGWLKSCNAQYRQFVYLSDAVWFKGKVTKKYVDENDEHCVDIESHGINQRGGEAISGLSTVILPSKVKGTSPIEKRLPAKEYRGTGKGVFF